MPLKEDKIVEILLKNRLKLTAYVRSIVGDFHTAEDIHQTVSMEAVRSASKFNDPDHLTRWLWKVCRNEAVRKLAHQKKEPLILDEQVLEAFQEELEKISPPSESETSIMLEKCMGRLSSFARQLIQMRYQKDMTGAVLAQAVNRKVESVYVALSRIHRKLEDCMKEQMNTAGGR